MSHGYVNGGFYIFVVLFRGMMVDERIERQLTTKSTEPRVLIFGGFMTKQ